MAFGLILKREARVEGIPPVVYVETLAEEQKKLLEAEALERQNAGRNQGVCAGEIRRPPQTVGNPARSPEWSIFARVKVGRELPASSRNSSTGTSDGAIKTAANPEPMLPTSRLAAPLSGSFGRVSQGEVAPAQPPTSILPNYPRESASLSASYCESTDCMICLPTNTSF